MSSVYNVRVCCSVVWPINVFVIHLILSIWCTTKRHQLKNILTEHENKIDTRNLAIANRSRVSSTHEVTTVNFQGVSFSRRKKHMGHCTLWHKFQGGIVFHGDSFSQGGNICDALSCGHYEADLTENRKIYIPHLYSTPPSEFRNLG